MSQLTLKRDIKRNMGHKRHSERLCVMDCFTVVMYFTTALWLLYTCRFDLLHILVQLFVASKNCEYIKCFIESYMSVLMFVFDDTKNISILYRPFL